MTVKIKESELRQIIVEELSSLREGVDHEGIKRVVTGAGKLLKACEAFKEGEQTPAMTNATTPLLDQLITILEAMISSPASYVIKKPVAPKQRVVKLRSQPVTK